MAKFRQTAPANSCNDIIKAFGLDPSLVFSFKLTIQADSAVIIEVEQFITQDQVINVPLLQMKRYMLTEIPGEDKELIDITIKDEM